MHINSTVIVFVLCLLMAGCSSSDEPLTDEESSIPSFESIETADVFAYECEDSLSFSAHLTQDSAWIFLPDTTVKTEPVRSGSGARYEGSAYLYWVKGDEALLQGPTGSLMTCEELPQEKAWQAAQIRGVDFRALGQEPGWYVEIIEEKKITYIGNYGDDTLSVATPAPEKNEGETVFEAKGEGRTLTIRITDKPCTDSMSGFDYPSTVIVSIDGQTYNGCGKYLN